MKKIHENIDEKIHIDKIFTKTLFLKGGLSKYITEDDFNEILKIFPNGEIQTIDKVGHWLHAENPVEFFKLV